MSDRNVSQAVRLVVQRLAKLFHVPRDVFMLGLVSLANDIASELILPLIPIFLTTTLGIPMTILGLIEGATDLAAYSLRVFAGLFSDRIKKRYPFVLSGYMLGTAGKIMLAFAFHWPLVLIARVVDKTGKSVRTPVRDAMIADVTASEHRGKAFGFHRMMDTIGAVIGPLLALVALALFGEQFHLIFAFACIPTIIGIFLLIFFVSEPKVVYRMEQATNLLLSWELFNHAFYVFLVTTILFSLANSSIAFLILRAKQLGLSSFETVQAYVLLNITYVVSAYPAGALSDKTTPKKVLIVGYSIFVLLYLFFALTTSAEMVWLLFPLYGLYLGLTDGVERAYIASIVPKSHRATALGIQQTVAGFMFFFASLLAGILWSSVSSSTPFLFSSILASIATVFFLIFGV